MSPEQIRDAQAEIASVLSPASITFLKKRHAAKQAATTAARSSTGDFPSIMGLS